MASTYVNDLRLNELATGDASGTWGTITNTNLELIAEAFSYGTEAITTNADTHTTTVADGATDPGRSMYLKYTGTLDSACTITIGPNTISKLWFIENGTSGSQNIIISQGSGASVTIPPGDTKVIYSDGAGSGAAMVDAFASLSVVDLKVQDDLTVTDDVSVGGDLTVTGTSVFTNLDISGDVDVDGTLEADAMTLDGTSITTTATLSTGISNNNVPKFTSGVVDDDFLRVNGTAIEGRSASEVLSDIGASAAAGSSSIVTTGALDSGSITSGFGTIDTGSSTITTTGAITGGSLVADNITIDSTEIDLSSGDLTIDVAGDIILDADGGNVTFSDGGTAIGDFVNSSSDFVIESKVQDKDIIFKGNDGGSEITALTLDMSAAGRVGIGNTSPSMKVDIKADNGDQLRLDNDGDRFTQLTIANNGTTKANFNFDNTDSLAEIFAVSGAGLKLSAGGSERVRITSGGDFLINKTAAAVSSEGFEFESNAARITKSGGTPLLLNRLSSDGVLLDLRKNSSQVGTISTNANSLPSDKNFKRDISDLDLGLNLIVKLKPSQYNYKIDDEGSPKMFGLIAQDLEKSLSEVGIEKNSTWLLQHDPKDDENQSDYSLDYLKLTPVLIKAVQEQQAQIEALQTEINTLKGK
tara:strand:+ start:1905 stop:3830 length:1926 start_codon:yes stop_codon:yes gene_type:complete